MSNNKEVKMKNLILYGLGDLYGGGAFLVLGTLYLIFLTDVVGLNPAKAGLVLVVGKAWDAISDPLMGYISDHTSSKFGRRRIYFLLAIAPIALSFILLWFPIGFNSQNYLFLYYMFAYMFFSTVFTMVMVPYTALNAEMSEDYKTRTKLSTSRMLFSQISALLSGVIPKIIVNYFSSNFTGLFGISGEKFGYMIMGVIFGIFYALPWIFVFWGTWELPNISKTTKESLKEKIMTFKSIFYNKSFRIHLYMYICAYVAMDFLMALFVYFLNYYLQLPDLFSYCMLAILLSQIIMLPVYMKISNKYGKSKAYIIGLSIWCLTMLSILFVNPGATSLLVIVICIFIGTGLSAGVMVPWAILPSITDVDEVITMEKRTGVYSGLMTLVRKMAQAVALWSIGYLLSLIGYVPNQAQTADTLLQLKLIFVFIPVILIILGIIAAFKFKITPKKHNILINEIKRLRQGGKRVNVDPTVRNICEELAGNSYFAKNNNRANNNKSND